MASTRIRAKKLNKPKPQALELSIPNHFRCPISLDLMKDPVTLSTGITYDRHSIEAWLDMGNSTCPVTNQELLDDDVIPNHSLRRLIQDWCVANRSLGVERIPTPKIPITTAQASKILSDVFMNPVRARELVEEVGRLAKESEKNRRCFASAGAARVLASLFGELACNGSLDGVLEDILSAILCFLPLDYEACLYLGSRDSLNSLASIMKFGDIAARLNAVAVIKEVLSTSKETVQGASETDGLIEALVELIRKPVSARATKASLGASFFLVSNNERTAMKFVDLGLVPLVLEVLVDSDKATCEKALALFDAVCSCERGREAACGHALTAPLLVKKMFRVSDLATEFAVSALWKLGKNCRGEEIRSEVLLIEAMQVGAFQKLLLLLQVGCSAGVKEKATELLKLMNGSEDKLNCIDVMDFKGLKRAF